MTARTYTTTEAAAVLGIDPGTVRQLRLAGKLKGQKVGPVWVFTEQELARRLAELSEKRKAS